VRGNISFNTDANNPGDANNSYANALLGNYDSYAEATGRPQGNYSSPTWSGSFRTTGRCEGICRSATACASTTTYRNTTLEISSRRSLQRAWDPKAAPVADPPGGRQRAERRHRPTHGKIYGQGLIGDFVPGVGNPANGQLQAGKNGVPQGIYKVARLA